MPGFTGHCPHGSRNREGRRGHTSRGTGCSLGQRVLWSMGSVRLHLRVSACPQPVGTRDTSCYIQWKEG
jgi:hypothetical protein